MFRFAHPEFLYLLFAGVPAMLLFVAYLIWRRRAISRIGNPALVMQLIPDYSRGKPVVKFMLLLMAFAFIVLGLANPQIGTKTEKVKRRGIDVIVAVDVSNSMMSEDVKPSRLDRAKNFISNFIDELSNDRLGMIVFAGNAYLQMPLTTDYSAARMYLRTVNTGLVPTQGTNLAEAIQLANESFAEGDSAHKALIIITDGEDNEGGVNEAVPAAVRKGVKIFTIGVGSGSGAPIPAGADFKRDEEGNIVLSKLNEEMLREIAAQGKGKFYLLGSGEEEIIAILRELKGIGTKELEETVFTDFADQYQWCLAVAAILLLLEWWISERRLRLPFLNA
jgi:Ca-activated chloride channel family protein